MRRFGKFDMQPVENNRTKRFVKNTQTHTHTNRMGSVVQANNLLVSLSGVSLVVSGEREMPAPQPTKSNTEAEYEIRANIVVKQKSCADAEFWANRKGVVFRSC